MDHIETLKDIVIILSVAVFVVAFFKKLKLSPVLGYFVAGGLLGEHGINFVTSHDTEFFGEIGVVFLLFAIGLELTFERLKSMRLHVFGFGSIQVIITTIILALIASLLSINIKSALIIGGGLALSSTAIVLQVVAENRDQSTQVGRLSLANLLMQDFAVVPLLVLIQILGDNSNSGIISTMGKAMFKAAIALIVIFILGRLFLRPIFNSITNSNPSKSNELFIATTLLVALGTAWATFEMGLSLALGAFAAGLLVAETEFQLQAEESIAPFKGLLLGVFFMTVGMTINLSFVLENLSKVAALSIGLVLIKATIILILAMVFKFSFSVAFKTGLLMCQGGEFAFILFSLAGSKGIMLENDVQILQSVVTITMAFTPLFAYIGDSVAKKLEKNKKIDVDSMQNEIEDLSNHVLVLGFGRAGKMVSLILEAENVNYLAVDINSEHVAEKRLEGFPIYLGNASNLETLKTVGIERASAVILAMDNKVTLLKTSKLISTHFPNIPIILRAKDLSGAEEFYEVGADIIVPETYETGLQLGGAVLKSIGISEFEVSRIKNRFRIGNYKKLPKDGNEENFATE